MGKIDINLNVFLTEFGLSEREINLYLTLLKTGPNTIMNLARETGIKRSTTHNNVEELIKKGLISQTNYGERRMVVAEVPEKLKFLIEQKKWSVKKMEEGLGDVVSMINQMVPQNKENTDVEVKYYKGKLEVQYIYNMSMKADMVYSFADLARYYQIFPDTQNVWEKALSANTKREYWDLVVDSKIAREIAKKKYARYHIKFLPNSDFFKGFGFADYLIFDDNVAIIQLDPEETMATVIHSKHIALSLRALHRSMWEMLPN